MQSQDSISAQVYLVRHGQASFGAADYDQLSELGFEQSRLLGAWFKDCAVAVDNIVTGGLQRHRQSADAFLDELSTTQRPDSISKDPGFDEFNHREVLTRYRPELTDLDAVKRLLKDSDDMHRDFSQLFSKAFAHWLGHPDPGQYSESWPAFRQRCYNALQQVSATKWAKNSVVFTSGGSITAITQALLGLPDERLFEVNLMLVNASVTRVVSRNGVLSLDYLNNYAHLQRANNPALVTLL